jgi:decaprenylphospho-beta-D-erythro-pentofuranosid-2-ulose 2-reductase
VVIAGGTSEIAIAIARALQRRSPRDVALLGRDLEALERAAELLRTEGCRSVSVVPMDAHQLDGHGEAVQDAVSRLGGIDVAILAVGVLEAPDAAPDDPPAGVEVLRVNLLGAGSLLLHLARALGEAGGGDLVVLSSVAAQRPRRANPVYGASKAGLDALAQALGDALRQRRVRVLVVRPGFVRTRMTAGLRPAPLATTPQAVAGVVLRGLDRHAHTVWAPAQVRWLMLGVRLLPRALMRRVRS